MVKGIARKAVFLENLNHCQAKAIFEMLPFNPNKGFNVIELNAFRIVFSYCCYFYKYRRTPILEYINFDQNQYYELAKKLARAGDLKNSKAKLSIIIKDRKMAEIIKLMEEGNGK